MKGKLILISLLLISFASHAQFDYLKAEKERVVKHKIKTITQTNYKYTKGKLSTEGILNSKKTFDKKGNIKEELLYKNNTVGTKILYTYDNKNRLIKFENHKGGKILRQLQEYIYNEKGFKVSEKGFNGNLGHYRTEYKYNPDGTNYLTVKYNQNDFPEEKWEYEHANEDVNIDVYKRGNFSEKIMRNFNSKKLLSEEIKYGKENQEKIKRTFKYNTNDQLIELIETRLGKFVKKEEYVYKNGLLAEVFLTKKGKDRVLDKSYIYDSNKNLIEEKWYDGQPGKYSSKKYKFDASNNLIQVETHYALYNYKVQNRFQYEKH